MLPKINRLKTKKQLDQVFSKGKGFREGFLFLKVAPNNFNVSRFGFIVGKNFSKKAAVRNKIKRRLREAIRTRISKTKKGFDAVFVVKPTSVKSDYSEVIHIVDILLKRSNLI